MKAGLHSQYIWCPKSNHPICLGQYRLQWQWEYLPTSRHAQHPHFCLGALHSSLAHIIGQVPTCHTCCLHLKLCCTVFKQKLRSKYGGTLSPVLRFSFSPRLEAFLYMQLTGGAFKICPFSTCSLRHAARTAMPILGIHKLRFIGGGAAAQDL